MAQQHSSISLVEATIASLLQALNAGSITSVELVSLYLHRIGQYDCRGPTLNSVCVINPQVFEEARASDDYRASGNTPRPLEGIPFTVKDSFRVEGMAVSAGSPAFADLQASEDAFIVSLLRGAGAIVLGRTNMPPMADGGIQRGLFGRAESPYNPKYSTTAYASGSSNGCGTSTACSFASFGFAGETVTSGRSPASNNALVGYSPSRGVIPIRGQWPLYPTCDVVVPHTRSVEDMLAILNIIVADDDADRGSDYWRNQKHIPIPKASAVRPDDYSTLKDMSALQGKRIAVPRCMIGVPGATPETVCSDSVRSLWDDAKRDLEAAGATVVETDFPLLEQYTKQDFPGQNCNVPGMPPSWTSIERCDMIAMAWDDFLLQNGDPNHLSLSGADPEMIRPLVAPMDDPSQHTEAQNQVRYSDMIEVTRNRKHSLYDFPGSKEALESLEAMRKRYFEDWMASNNFDFMAFPTNGDVPYADADESLESMKHAVRDGIKYANGGRCLKHVGIPCITIPMGVMQDKQMPVGITFATKAHDDPNLLRYAYSYEQVSQRRTIPPSTPALGTDKISLTPSIHPGSSEAKPMIKIASQTWTKSEDPQNHLRSISLSGTIQSTHHSSPVSSLQVFINGELSAEPPIHYGGEWKWTARVSRPKLHERFPTMAPVPKYHILVVLVASLINGRKAGCLIEVD